MKEKLAEGNSGFVCMFDGYDKYPDDKNMLLVHALCNLGECYDNCSNPRRYEEIQEGEGGRAVLDGLSEDQYVKGSSQEMGMAVTFLKNGGVTIAFQKVKNAMPDSM